MQKGLAKKIAAACMAAAVTLGSAGTLPELGICITDAYADTQTIYSGTNTLDINDLDLVAEDWNTKLPDYKYDESISGVTAQSDMTMTADVTLDASSYESLDTDGDYFKVQGVIKVSDSWKWNQGKKESYLDKNSFKKDGSNYKTSISIDFIGVDPAPSDLKLIEFRVVGQGFKGSVKISNVNLTANAEDNTNLPEAEDTVVDDFESYKNGDNAGWENETGWQYNNTITPEVTDFNGSQVLKLNLDYTGCEKCSWSEAKINKSFDGYDISAYNRISYDIIYPTEADGKLKAKVFAKNTDGTEIINKDTSLTSEDYTDGYKKATVTIAFDPSSVKLTDMTIGTVGVNTSFKGDVYIDNITLSQYNASSDYTDITSEVSKDYTKADTTNMPSTITLSDKNATSQAKALYSYLKGLSASDQVLFGHQNDTHKTVRSEVESDTKDITGSISGIVGIDSLALTGTEIGETDVNKAITKSAEISKAAAKDGAIITLSAHMPNMSNSKIKATPDAARPYDFSKCDFSESKDLSNNCSEEVLPGGKYNERYTAYLDIIADYAKQLGDIPVLFRPLHECDGGWFWWGSATTDKETYKALYRYTEDYLTSKGVHNFIYVYSPGGPVEEEKYLSRYPGDDYVDVLGFDYYNDYSTYPAEYSDDFFTNLAKSCEVLGKIADAKGKVSAISETGVRVEKADGSDNEGLLVKGNPIKGHDWYKKVNDIAKKNGQSYFLLWANFSDSNFYVPYKCSDKKGQELINEFIDFYNDSSSVFANGTNFYNSAENETVENDNAGAAKGYFTNIFSKGTITAPCTIKANVSYASKVQFVLKNGSTEQTVAAVKVESSDEYSGQVTAEMLNDLGKTDTGTIALVADGKTLSTLSFISFGQEKANHSKDTIDDFELYYGDADYLNGTYSENSAAGCTSSFSLNSESKAAGEYSGSFNYTLKNSNSEVWTGRKMSLPYSDYSEYNALSMWVKPDGNGQKLVIQITSNGEDFEAYLNDFVKTTDAKYVTIPFSKMKGKNGGKVDPSKITNFAIWCNSVANNTDLTSSILFDQIKFGKIDESSVKASEGGYVVSDSELIKSDQSSSGSGSSGNSGSGSSSNSGSGSSSNSGSGSTDNTGSGTTGQDPANNGSSGTGDNGNGSTSEKPDNDTTEKNDTILSGKASDGTKVTVVVSDDGKITVTGAKPKQLITAKDSNGKVIKLLTNASGKVAKKEIVKVGKVKYLAAADGQLASNETVKVGKSYYYADKNGKLVTKDKKIVKDSNGSRYITKKSGKLYTSQWVKIGKKKYKVSKTGKITQVKTIKSSKKK